MDDEMLRQYCSPIVREQSASVIQIESGKLIPVALALVCVSMCIAGVAIGLSLNAIDNAHRAERETRLQRLETDELKAAVVRSGIKIHLETDSP